MSSELRIAIARAGKEELTVTLDALALAVSVLALTGPILVVAGVAAAATSVVQSKGMFAASRVVPTLARLNVASGFAQLFSRPRLFVVVRATLYGAATAWLAFATLREHAGDLARTSGHLRACAVLAANLALSVATRTAILGVFLAALDIVVTRWSWRKTLRMTRAEVRREQRETDGDPQLRAARSREHDELFENSVLADVEHATLVVIDERRSACALRYDAQRFGSAPVIVANAHGARAARLVDLARAHGVPTVHNSVLAQALAVLEDGAAVPEARFEAVAEALREAWNPAR